ncbi:hypothetical protein ABZ800_12285 [Streptomyces sp. NPDC047813]|uniref:hypothetical protein n=1 Tax=Streptomyces sp. NPDC047813 TaxID=3154608 RepID=UPI0033E164BF
MIRIVTTDRLKRLEQDADRARAGVREVQARADTALGRHVHNAVELTARAEQAKAAASAARWAKDTAETEAKRLREQIGELEAALERAEATTDEVGVLLSSAMKELSISRQELLLKDIAIGRLREELEAEPVERQSLTVLLHHGEPHTIYASREDAHADTATHGLPADHVWKPCDERPASAFTWRCEAFIYNSASNGFRRLHMPALKQIEGAA